MTHRRLSLPGNVPFGRQAQDYLDWCQFTRGMSAATIAGKRYNLMNLYHETGVRDVRALTNQVVDQWFASAHARCVSATHHNRRLSTLRGFVNYHRELGLVVPVKLLLLRRQKEQPPEQIFYSRQEIRQVLRQTTDPIASLMIRIAFDTGLRASELMRLRLCEIRGQRLTFLAKGGVRRDTFITSETARALTRYVASHHITDYLWPARSGYPGHIAYNTLRQRLRRAFSQAGFQGFHPHALRHSYVADLEAQGATVDEIFAMLGHQNIKSTQHYLHRIKSAERLAKLHKKYRKW